MIVKQLITRLGFKNDESGYRKYKNTQNKAKRDSERFVRSIKSDHIGLHKRVIHGHVNMIRKMVGGMRSYKARASRTYDSLVSKARASFAKIAASQAKANAKSSMGGMSSGKAIMGIGGAYAAYSGVSKLTNELINAGTNLESNMARLEVVMGNKSAAKQIFDKMAVFAEKTPFKMNELLSGFASIKGSGYQMTDEDLTGLGNLASGSKKSMGEMFEMLKSANRGLGAMVDNFDGLRASAAGGMLEVSRFNKETQKWESQSFKQGDMGGILKYVAAHGNKSFAGSMQKQSQTFGGKMSTLFDRIEGRFRDLWQGGADKFFHMLLNYALDLSSKIKPFVETIIPKLIKGMAWLKQYLPAIGAAIGFMVARFAGLKLIAAGGWIIKTVWALRGLTLGSIAAQVALFAIPAAITAAVVAVGYLGYEIYKFATTGKGLIKNLSDKFPAFGKAVEGLKKAMIDLWVEVKPYALEFWELMKQLGEWIYTEGAKAFKWLYKEAIIPMIIEGIKWLTQFIKDWVDGFKTIIQWGKDWYSGYKTIMEWFRKTIKGLSDDFNYWYDGMVGIFDYIKEKFDWLIGAAGRVGNAVKGAFDWLGFGGGDAGNGSITENPNFPLNNKAAADLVRNARSVFSGSKRCLNGVWQAYTKTFGANNAKTKALHHGSAYAAARTLKSSGQFRELKVTPQMLKDPNMMKLLHGATAVYNQSAGFSKKHGHIEVWDMVNKKALYGNGQASLNRSAHMLQNARVFVPITPGGGGGMQITNNTNVNVGPNAPASEIARKTGDAVGNNTRNALHKTANSTPKRSNGLAYTQ